MNLEHAAREIRNRFPNSSNSHELWRPWGKIVGLRSTSRPSQFGYCLQAGFYTEYFDHGGFFRDTEGHLVLTGMPYVECSEPVMENLNLESPQDDERPRPGIVTIFRCPWSFYSSRTSLVIAPGLRCTRRGLSQVDSSLGRILRGMVHPKESP